jgi:hypothetical protein
MPDLSEDVWTYSVADLRGYAVIGSNEIDDATLYIEGLEWFACDEEDRIGHFDTLGLRHLPRTVKSDRRTAERLIAYFFEEAKDLCEFSLRDKVEGDFGGWESKKITNKADFIEHFGRISRKGLFSHDTQAVYRAEAAEAAKRLGVFSPGTEHIYDLDGSASYYLVTIPEHPLHLSDLPNEIAEMVARVRSPFPFGVTTHFKESETMLW